MLIPIIILVLSLFGPGLFLSLRYLRSGQELYAFGLPFLFYIVIISCYVYLRIQPCHSSCELTQLYAIVLLSLGTVAFTVTQVLLLILYTYGNYVSPKNNK